MLAAGDLLLHAPLLRRGTTSPGGWLGLWGEAIPWVQAADMAYLNFEGAISCCLDSEGQEHPDPGGIYDGVVYTGEPFNYPPSVAHALAETGFDVVSTANNHALDRGPAGADQTGPYLEAAGLQYTGTRPGGDPQRPWYTVVERSGFRVAWLACTEHTNGPKANPERVLYCRPEQTILELVRELAARDDIDAVIVVPHGGVEYVALPTRTVVDRAHRLVEAGALAVLNNHPHVVQTGERYVTADGRETFIQYSLGNFVSNQRRFERRAGILLLLGLGRDSPASPVHITGVRYVPTWMQRGKKGVLELLRPDPPGKARQLVAGRVGCALLLDPGIPPGDAVVCRTDGATDSCLGGIGAACREGTCAAGLSCLGQDATAQCTTSCSEEAPCPAEPGRSPARCVGAQGQALCRWSCSTDFDCRERFFCRDGACQPGSG